MSFLEPEFLTALAAILAAALSVANWFQTRRQEETKTEKEEMNLVEAALKLHRSTVDEKLEFVAKQLAECLANRGSLEDTVKVLVASIEACNIGIDIVLEAGTDILENFASDDPNWPEWKEVLADALTVLVDTRPKL